MPCRVDGSYERIEESLKMKHDLDNVTRLLCSVMTVIHTTPEGDNVLKIVDGLKEWWEAHIISDKERRHRDFETAMSKLTEDEREAILAMIAGK